jgi:hypothetical protein
MIITMTNSKLRKGRTSGSLVVEEFRENVRSFVSTDLLRYRTRPQLESGCSPYCACGAAEAKRHSGRATVGPCSLKIASKKIS